jgi:hypothetical protein
LSIVSLQAGHFGSKKSSSQKSVTLVALLCTPGPALRQWPLKYVTHRSCCKLEHCVFRFSIPAIDLNNEQCNALSKTPVLVQIFQSCLVNTIMYVRLVSKKERFAK